MPQTFHQRRPVFEAVQYLPGTNCPQVAEFIGAPVHPPGECNPDAELDISPNSGYPIVQPGWWMIRDTEGQLSTCPPDVFTERYEPT